MPIRRVLRVAARVAAVFGALAAVYVVVTFVQVLLAAGDDTDRSAQAIVVLGAAQYDGVPSPVLRNRLDHAIELYEAGRAPAIVVTGGKQPGDRFTEAAASYRYLREHEVPEFAILREEQGANTWEQLAATQRFLAEVGIHEVLLVSDDYHALRIRGIASEVGLDAEVSPVDPGLSVAGTVKAMAHETAAVAVGRIITFRRLVSIPAP